MSWKVAYLVAKFGYKMAESTGISKALAGEVAKVVKSNAYTKAHDLANEAAIDSQTADLVQRFGLATEAGVAAAVGHIDLSIKALHDGVRADLTLVRLSGAPNIGAPEGGYMRVDFGLSAQLDRHFLRSIHSFINRRAGWASPPDYDAKNSVGMSGTSTLSLLVAISHASQIVKLRGIVDEALEDTQEAFFLATVKAKYGQEISNFERVKSNVLAYATALQAE